MGVHQYSGRIPITDKSAKKILKNVSTKSFFSKKNVKDTLGDYLRSNPTRPTFGDDSELSMFGVKNKKPHLYNIADPSSGSSYVRGYKYKIIGDSTVGGLELNVKPGNADELHKNVRRALVKGTKKIPALKDKSNILISNTLAETKGFDWSKPLSKEHMATGASTHIHFQAPAAEMRKKLQSVLGATAPLNYVVPTAKERAKGYKGHGTFKPGFTYGNKLPLTYVWENPSEKGLAKKYHMRTVQREHERAWYPNKGNLAAEVRFNAPMHSDPHLSKKYLQLTELALSDTQPAKELQTLGRQIIRNTGGKHSKLFRPEVKKQVLTSFEKILSRANLSTDTHLTELIQAAKKNKVLPIQNVVKLWSKFKI
jgi:hypothetical protein